MVKDEFLTAYVSIDGKIIGIEHDTDADYADVHVAHVALRDRLNERLNDADLCPFSPKPDSEGVVEEGVVTRDDLVEALGDVIQDSLDMDWTGNDGAIAVADYFDKERMSVIRRGGRDLQAFEDGWNEALDWASEVTDKYFGAAADDACTKAWAEYSTEQKPCENRFALLQRVNELNVKAGASATGETFWTVTVLYNTVIYCRDKTGAITMLEVIEGVPQ